MIYEVGQQVMVVRYVAAHGGLRATVVDNYGTIYEWTEIRYDEGPLKGQQWIYPSGWLRLQTLEEMGVVQLF